MISPASLMASHVVRGASSDIDVSTSGNNQVHSADDESLAKTEWVVIWNPDGPQVLLGWFVSRQTHSAPS